MCAARSVGAAGTSLTRIAAGYRHTANYVVAGNTARRSLCALRTTILLRRSARFSNLDKLSLLAEHKYLIDGGENLVPGTPGKCNRSKAPWPPSWVNRTEAMCTGRATPGRTAVFADHLVRSASWPADGSSLYTILCLDRKHHQQPGPSPT